MDKIRVSFDFFGDKVIFFFPFPSFSFSPPCHFYSFSLSFRRIPNHSCFLFLLFHFLISFVPFSFLLAILLLSSRLSRVLAVLAILASSSFFSFLLFFSWYISLFSFSHVHFCLFLSSSLSLLSISFPHVHPFLISSQFLPLFLIYLFWGLDFSFPLHILGLISSFSSCYFVLSVPSRLMSVKPLGRRSRPSSFFSLFDKWSE